MKPLCLKLKLFIGFFLMLNIGSDFSTCCMASKRPPPAPRKGRLQGSVQGGPVLQVALQSGGLRCSSEPRAPITIGESFAFRTVVTSMTAFLDQCHFVAHDHGWIEARIVEKIRAIYNPVGLFDMTPEIIAGRQLLTGFDVDVIFNEVILRLADESGCYDVMPVLATAPPTAPLLSLGCPLASTSGSGMHDPMLGSYASPSCRQVSSGRFLPELTPEIHVIGLAHDMSNHDIMSSLISHILYAPPTCIDPDLYNFVSWLFKFATDGVTIERVLPSEGLSSSTQRSFAIMLSLMCSLVAHNMQIPVICYGEAPDVNERVTVIKGRIQATLPRSRHYEACEDAWLKQLMVFVDIFIQKDAQRLSSLTPLTTLAPRSLTQQFSSLPLSSSSSSSSTVTTTTTSSTASPSPLSPSPVVGSFTSLAMNILGFYFFQHMQNLEPRFRDPSVFANAKFMGMYGSSDDLLAKEGLFASIKISRLPTWLLIPFDAVSATRVVRRLMTRIHQYCALLTDNVLGPQCEWCRREARSLYAQLHGYVDMLIQTFISSPLGSESERLVQEQRKVQSRTKLFAVFERINFFVNPLMKIPGCPLLIGRAYEELMIIAKKIVDVLHIDPTLCAFNNCVVVKSDHLCFVVNEREGAGDDGEGGHIHLDPSMRGDFFGFPFRYHLHNSINIKEDASLYKNEHVISDFSCAVRDPMTGVAVGDWVMCKKSPATESTPLGTMVPIRTPATLTAEGTKLATLFPPCYSNHTPVCFDGQHALICGHEHIFDYCQKLWNIVQAFEQKHFLIGHRDSDGCCLLAAHERSVQDSSLPPGETLTNKMYVFQHPHIYGCADLSCPLRGSPKPMIVALYAWVRTIPVVPRSASVSTPLPSSSSSSSTATTTSLLPPPLSSTSTTSSSSSSSSSAPTLSVTITKIASMYPLIYFDPSRGEPLPLPPPTTPPPPIMVQTIPPTVPSAPSTSVTPPPLSVTPVPQQPLGISPDGIELLSPEGPFRLIKRGILFEKIG